MKRKINYPLFYSLILYGYFAGSLESEIGKISEPKVLTWTSAILVFIVLISLWIIGFETAKHHYKNNRTP